MPAVSVGLMADKLRFIRHFPDTCCAEVTHDGMVQPCDKTAVAVAAGDEEDGTWWPVCGYHTRGRKMVPLSELIAVVPWVEKKPATYNWPRYGTDEYAQQAEQS